MTEARALWHTSADLSRIEEDNLGRLKVGWCEVRSLYSAISGGTERLVATGQVPEDLHEEMRCPYMGGQFTFPVKYGYSLVGEIVNGPKGRLGEVVHVMHPHQDRCLVRTDDAFRIPSGVPPRRAILASNLETALNALWDSRVAAGERAVVVGFGMVGSLVARLLCIVAEARVTVVDIDPEKIDLAGAQGFLCFPPDAIPRDFHVAFHTSGSSQGLQMAIDSVGFEGRVIEMSWYGTRWVTLHLGGTFHSQRKTIISSQVSTIAPSHRSTWDHQRRKRLVFSLLQREEFDDQITHSVQFPGLPKLFEELRKSPLGGLGCVVTY